MPSPKNPKRTEEQRLRDNAKQNARRSTPEGRAKHRAATRKNYQQRGGKVVRIQAYINHAITFDEIVAIAKKYATRAAWGEYSRGPDHTAYCVAGARGILEEVYSAAGGRPVTLGGFKTDRPGFLYYLKLRSADGRVLYKIGITNNFRHRFKASDRVHIDKVLLMQPYGLGRHAYDVELHIKNLFAPVRAVDKTLFPRAHGGTELFSADVLELDAADPTQGWWHAYGSRLETRQ